MGSLLLVLAAVLFVASIVVLVVALRRPRKAAGPRTRQDPLASDAMPQFGPRQLGPGAIVSHGGVDYVVRGSVTFHEGPFVWWEHLLEGGEQPVWLSVEEDDGRLELAMWTGRKDVPLRPGDPSERCCSASWAPRTSSPSSGPAATSPSRCPARPAASAARCPGTPTRPATASSPGSPPTTSRRCAGSHAPCAAAARPEPAGWAARSPATTSR